MAAISNQRTGRTSKWCRFWCAPRTAENAAAQHLRTRLTPPEGTAPQGGGMALGLRSMSLLAAAAALVLGLTLSSPVQGQAGPFDTTLGGDTPVEVNEGNVTGALVRLLPRKDEGIYGITVSSDNPDIRFSKTDDRFAQIPPRTETLKLYINNSIGVHFYINSVADADNTDDTADIKVTAETSGPDWSPWTYTSTVKVKDQFLALELDRTELTLIEGTKATFKAKFSVDPGEDQTINLTTSSSSEVTVNPTSLTFTSGSNGNWDDDQTVTITSVADSDKSDDTHEISFSFTDEAETRPLPLTIYEESVLTLTPSSLTMSENSSSSFTVQLANQPSHTRTVNLKSDDTKKMKIDKSTLTFTRGNWNVPQTVKVDALLDDSTEDFRGNITFTGTKTTTSESGNSKKTGVASTTLSVLIEDFDGILLSKSEVNINEGSSGTFTVVLRKQPDNNTTLNLSSSNTDVTLSASTLTFTKGNWNVPQTVTVSAAHDSDASPGNETAEITVSGSGYTSHKVVVEVRDDDAHRVLVEPIVWVIREGDTIDGNNFDSHPTFKEPVFSLSGRPPAGGTQMFVVDNSFSGTRQVTPGSVKFYFWQNNKALNFAGQNFRRQDYDNGNELRLPWDTTSLTAREDDDTDDNEYKLRAYVTHNDFNTTDNPTIITLRVLDNDSYYPLLSTSGLTVVEGGSATFTVRLRQDPGQGQTATINMEASHFNKFDTSSNDITIKDTDSKTDGDQTTLSFTGGDDGTWKTPQTVTVTAKQDTDKDPDKAIITFKNTGLSTDPVLNVSIEDNDVELEVSTSSLDISEGLSKTFTVKLKSATVENRVLTLSPTISDITVTPATLTFTRGNWNIAQEVTVNALEEDDDSNDNTATINITETNVKSESVAVQVHDNDIGITLSHESMSVIEGDRPTFTVKLAIEPDGDRVINLRSGNPDVTINPTSLTFIPNRWSTEQTVTLTLKNDTDQVPDTAVIYLEGDEVENTSLSLSIRDDDLKGIIVEPTLWEIKEGANITSDDSTDFTYPTFKLNSRLTLGYTQLEIRQTSADGIAPSDKIVIGGDDGVIGIRIEPGEWNTAMSHIDWSNTVHLQALDDDDKVDNEYSLTIKGIVTDGGTREYVGVSTEVTLRVLDDDLFVPVPSATTLPVTEGASKKFTVKLRERPDTNATIDVASSLAEVTVDKTQLIFTPSNWNDVQEVTVTAAADSDKVDDHATVTLTGTGARTITVDVPVRDDDLRLILSDTALAPIESGSALTFTVKLDAAPTYEREVTLSSDNTDVTFSPAKLDFTADDWSNTQTVNISAADDADKVDDTASISLSGAGFQTASVAVTASDDDIGLTLSTQTLTVSESSSEELTVELDSVPINSRAVILSSDNTDVSFSKTSLNFTSANWNQAQTVTISAADDADNSDEAVKVSLQTQGVKPAEVALTVNDDELALVLSKQSLSIVEGESDTFTAKLAAKPISDRTLTLSSDNTDVTFSPATLTFTAADWSTEQEVTVNTAVDADRADDSATIRLTGDDVVSGSVSVSVSDDDIKLVLSPSTVNVIERDSATFTVQLAAPPSQTRTVALTSDNGDISPSPTTLTFSTGNWNQAQTVTLSARDDGDKLDETVEISLAGTGVRNATLTANLLENDIGPTLSVSTLTVSEGGSKTFTVQLDSVPVHTRTLTPTSDNTDLTFTPTPLTFTADDWNTPQTVTVNAAEDDDTVNDSTTVSMSADGLKDVPLTLTVDDNDIGLTLVPASALDVVEGTPKTFTVSLDLSAALQAAADKTVTLTSDNSDVTIDTDAGTTGNQNTLTFTAPGRTVYTVTVTAAEDADKIDAGAKISLTGSGVTDASLAVTVHDDDLDLILSKTSLTVAEGNSDTLTVRMSAPPTRGRKVKLTSNNSEVTLSPTELNFTANNWALPQTVTLNTAQDTDNTDDSVTVSLSGNGGESASVAVKVADDDRRRIIVTPTVWEIREGDEINSLTNSYFRYPTFRLSHQPASSMQFWVRQPGDNSTNDLSDSDKIKFFQISNNARIPLYRIGNNISVGQWNQEKQISWGAVSLQVLQDDDTADNEITLQVYSEHSEYDDTTTNIKLRILDDDIVVPVLSRSTLSLAEGESGVFTVKLRAQPSANVALSLTSDNADVTLNRTTLNFTTTDWNTAKTVRATASEDADSTSETAKITVAGTGARNAELTVYIDDQDLGLTLTPGTLTVDEGKSTRFTAQLAAGPLGSRTVSLASDNTDITLEPTTLDFSLSNWNTPQTVVVSDAGDADKTDDTATITLSGTGVTQDTVSLTVHDDDIGYTLSPTSLTIDEGESGHFNVQLDTQPTSDRTITLSSDNADVTIDTDTGTTGNQTSLTFTNSNWNTDQRVTVSAAEDDDGDKDSATITLGGSGTAGGSLTVAVDDDDIGLTLSQASLNVAEGKSQSFKVRLASQPIADRTVELNSDNNDIAFSGDDTLELTFTSENWNIDQTATLSADDDPGKHDESAEITLRGAGVSEATLTVSVLDDDISHSLDPSTLTVDEGGVETFEVELDTEPEHSRTVELASDNPDVTLSPTSLTFGEDDWDTAQTVTVRAAGDADRTTDTATITLSGEGATDSTLSVTVSDDDIGYVLMPALLTIHEGSSEDFTVRLDNQPSGERTVQLTSDNTEVTLDKTRLTFTETDWDTAQTVKASAAHDVDRAHDEAVISLSGTGLVDGSIDVTVTEDDLFTLTLSPSALTLGEGGQGMFTVRPSTQPPSDLNITLKSGSSDITLDETSLAFTPADWETAQTVTVSVGHDLNAEDETVPINMTGLHLQPATLNVTVTDDDISHTLSPSSLTAVEGGSVQFKVRLDADPSSSKTLRLVSDNADVTLSPDLLTFTTGNWQSDQTVTVSAGQDTDSINDRAIITLQGDAGLGADLADGSLVLTVYDDDIELLPSVSSLDVAEGASGSFAVRLSATPTSSVSVSLASDNNDVTLSPTTALSFDSSNWNRPQTVTVSAGQDSDNLNETAQISLTSSIGASASVEVSVQDDERSTLVLSVTELDVIEGAGASFRVRMNGSPSGGATIDVSLASDNTDVKLDAASLQFTAANWNIEQVVEITTEHDVDDISEEVKISLTGAGVVPTSVAVTLADDDLRVLLSSGALLIDEGQSKTLGVRLSAAPSADLSLTLSAGNSAVSLSDASLDFTPTDWRTDKVVTVSANHDSDNTDASAVISLAATAPVPVGATVSVTVPDDEIRYVLSPTSLTVTEGASGAFTIKLSAQPSDDRTITLTSTNPDVVPSPASLDFTDADWNTAQSVTLSAARDGDITNDTAQVSVVAPGGTATNSSVAVDVTDDGNIAITLSSTLLKMSEDDTKTFEVQMQRSPAASVTISLTSSNPRVQIDKHALVFTSGNWSAPQTVTLTAIHDDDKNDDSAQISLSGSGVTNASVTVEVTDDDSIGLTLSSTLLRMSEGAVRDFTVQLRSAPTENMTVRLAASNSEVSLDKTSLEFTPSDWGTAQTVTVTATQDSDSNDEFDQIAISGDGIRTAQVAVEVTDDDSIRLSLSATQLSMNEGGSGSFTVHLIDRPPSGSVQINLASTLSSVTVSPASLSFTADSWSNPQTVSLSAAQDDDKADDSAVISLTGAGVKAASVSVQVLDDDNLRLNLSATRLSLEEGAFANLSVSLQSTPGKAVKISLASSEPGVTVSPTSLDFNSGNWSRVQTVRVSAAQDSNKSDELAVISLSSPDVASAAVTVAVTDDDSIRLNLSASQLNISEGSSTSFEVQLSAQPDSAVSVKLASTHAGVTLSQDSLSFTTGNWSTVQTVTVRAAQDADKNDESAQISLTGIGITGASVAVTVTDDDRIGLTLSSTLVRLVEGTSAQFRVRLLSAPIADTSVSLVSSNSEVTLGAASLTFTPSNWSADQTVTLTAVQDADGNDDSAQIQLSGNGIRPASVSVEITDNDTIRLNLSATSQRLTEGGSGSFDVSLQAAPSAAVKITLSSTNSDVTLNPTELDFTTSNWSAAQTVTLSAAQDADTLEDQAVISLSGTSVVAATVSVTVVDDDSTFLSLSSALLSAVEGGAARFTVALQREPGAAVKITLSSSNPDVTLNKTALDFNATNWSTAQTVIITAAQDTDLDNDSAHIWLTGEGVTPASVTVMVSDDDRARLNLSSTAVDVAEGGTGRFSVSLQTAPNQDVTVSLSSSNSDVTLDKTSLDFTTANWSAPQDVTVTAAQDDDTDNNTMQIDLAGAGVEGGLISVRVLDDDRIRLNLSSTLLGVAEGGSIRFAVSLQTQPSDLVTVGLSSTSSAVTLSQTSLFFTTDDWNVAQNITLTAGQDADSLDNTVQIALAGAGVVDGEITVTIQDDDLVQLKLSSTLLNVAEGGTSTFTVELGARPSAAVSLSLSSSNSEVTLSPASLSFTTSNWNTAQTVTLSAAQDDDATDDTAQIRIFGAGAVTGVASVMVEDDDLANLVLSSTLVGVIEGGSSIFSVALKEQPAAAVTVRLEPSSSEITLSPTSLSFTADNWSTAQNVAITAAEDDDPLDDTKQITLSGAGVRSGSVSVAVEDNDRSQLILSSSLVTIDEGDTASFNVQLGERSTIDATITLSSTNSEITISPASMSFTASNWNTPQEVTLSAADDADAINDTGQIYLSGAGVQTALASVTVEDSDRARPTPSSPELTLPGGLARSFTVQLVSAPVADTTVRLTPDSPKVNLNPTSLDFTAGNWQQPQNVTVSAERPETSDGYSVEINMTGIGVRPTLMKIKVANETVVGLTLTGTGTGSPVNVDEGDTTGATFMVRLGAAPDGPRTIELVSSNADVIVEPTRLTFATDTWQIDQTVTVIA
ncbi:MAG: hypothetical protein ISN29_12705, partial [Gammaproteobacteria bacterium AqS3]|nr:hypothetical protein [Gammaproteobacteria bacterium AqS3]